MEKEVAVSECLVECYIVVSKNTDSAVVSGCGLLHVTDRVTQARLCALNSTSYTATPNT